MTILKNPTTDKAMARIYSDNAPRQLGDLEASEAWIMGGALDFALALVQRFGRLGEEAAADHVIDLDQDQLFYLFTFTAIKHRILPKVVTYDADGCSLDVWLVAQRVSPETVMHY